MQETRSLKIARSLTLLTDERAFRVRRAFLAMPSFVLITVLAPAWFCHPLISPNGSLWNFERAIITVQFEPINMSVTFVSSTFSHTFYALLIVSLVKFDGNRFRLIVLFIDFNASARDQNTWDRYHTIKFCHSARNLSLFITQALIARCTKLIIRSAPPHI